MRDHLSFKTTYHLVWSYHRVSTAWASCQIRKLQVAHAPGMRRMFSLPPQISDASMHHGMCMGILCQIAVTYMPWYMPGYLTSSFLLRWCRGNHCRHSWHTRNPQFYVSGKRPIHLCSHRWWSHVECRCVNQSCVSTNTLWSSCDVDPKRPSSWTTLAQMWRPHGSWGSRQSRWEINSLWPCDATNLGQHWCW